MSRTILAITQSVAKRTSIPVPIALFTSTTRTELELQEIAQEAAERIVRAHDWQVLKTRATVDGDGTTTDFALPTDYLRMPKDAQVWSTRWQRPLLQVTPEDDLRLQVREYDLVQGAWTIIGGNIRFRPALAATEDAYYLYISNAVVDPASGLNKARFDTDTDLFLLDDRLLELHMIAEWRNRKGLPAEDDAAIAMHALGQAISDDKGARILTQSSRNNVRGKVSYPWNVGV